MDSQITAMLYTVRDQIKTPDGLKKTLERLRAIGFENVELATLGDYSISETKAALDTFGLRAVSLHVGWPECMEQIDSVLDRLTAVDAKYATIGILPPEYYSASGLKRFLRELPPVAERFKRANRQLAFHNHSIELTWLEGKPWLAHLYAQATPEQLVAELDTYWLQHGGADPSQWLADYARRVPLLHMKDMVATSEWEPRFAEVGSGNLNWPAIVASARAADVQWFIIEQDDCFGRDPVESLADSFRFVQSLGIG